MLFSFQSKSIASENVGIYDNKVTLYDMIFYVLIWYDMIWDMIRYDAMWCDMRYDVIKCDIIWYYIISCHFIL